MRFVVLTDMLLKMLHLVSWWIVTDVSEDCSAFIFRIKQSRKRCVLLILIGAKEEDTVLLNNYFPMNVTSCKTWIFKFILVS
jgi:hypothetical protein